jgi:hypothetical protein
MMIRFHLDEHVSPAIAVGLRQRGIDVTTSIEAGLLGAEDRAHLAYSLTTGRVIVTHDDDFLAQHANGVSHSGIAYCHQEKYKIGELLRALLLLHGGCDQDEMRGRVEFL